MLWLFIVGLILFVIGAIVALVGVLCLDQNGKPDENGDINKTPQCTLAVGLAIWTLGVLLLFIYVYVTYESSCSIAKKYVAKPKDVKKTGVVRATPRPPTVTQPTFARPPVTSAASF